MSLRRPLKAAVCQAGLAYVYGLVIGGLSMAVQLLSREALPGMTWWQWILAPLALGDAAMGGELLVQTLQNRTGLGDYGHSRSKRLIHLALLFALLAAFAAGTALYRLAAVDAPQRMATGA